jgi:HK97 family phage portal protein
MSRTEIITTRPESPSVLSRLWGSLRSYMVGPLTSRSPELAKYFGGGGAALSGVTVNEHSATSLSAVWAAVGLISDDISSLPLMLYKRLSNGGKDKFEDHPLYRLLHDEPNTEMGSMVFRRTLQTHVLIWQNAYAEIERDRAGRPVALWPLVPESVRPVRNRSGVLQYEIHNPSGSVVTIQPADMIHLLGRSHDGTTAGTIIEKAKESLGLALAAEQFGATFFGNGATFGGVISYKGPRPPEMSEESYRASLESRHQGVKRAHKILALYNEAVFTPTGVEPNAAQFLETRTFQIREVARWFKIPPHKLADLADATFSNVEQMNTEYFVSALRPWLVLWEQELSRKLISRLERRQQFVKHRLEGLLRGDSESRAAFYQTLFNIGAITINEIRELEDWDPLPGGDEAFIQVNNLMPLSKAMAYADAVIEAQKGRNTPPRALAAPDDGASAKEIKSALASIESRLDEQAAKLAAEAARAATAESLLAQKAQQYDALQADCDASATAIAERDKAAAELEERYKAEFADQIGKTAEQIADLERQWQAERDRIVAERQALVAEKNDLDVMLGVAEKERDEAKRAADESSTREREWQAAIDTLNDELEQVRATEATTQALAEELRTQLAAQREAGERLALEHAKVEAARALAEAQRADKEAELVLVAAERATATRAHAETENRLQAIEAAHRALIVDALERLLQREADRARKAQATPEKLRAWVESFYQTHADTCRSVLRPVVLAWAPCAGVNAETVLSELVRDHIDTSRRDLRMAADTDDPDELAANLARVLRRWETERADAVADRLLAEGDRHGH